MITLFVIGILVFTGKLVHFAVKAAWGITKWVLFAIGIPALLFVLFAAGLVTLAVPQNEREAAEIVSTMMITGIL